MSPRFISLPYPRSAAGFMRINLSAIIRWQPMEGGSTQVVLDERDDHGGQQYLNFPDPDGRIDKAICSAFYDVTPGDLLS